MRSSSHSDFFPFFLIRNLFKSKCIFSGVGLFFVFHSGRIVINNDGTSQSNDGWMENYVFLICAQLMNSEWLTGISTITTWWRFFSVCHLQSSLVTRYSHTHTLFLYMRESGRRANDSFILINQHRKSKMIAQSIDMQIVVYIHFHRPFVCDRFQNTNQNSENSNVIFGSRNVTKLIGISSIFGYFGVFGE